MDADRASEECESTTWCITVPPLVNYRPSSMLPSAQSGHDLWSETAEGKFKAKRINGSRFAWVLLASPPVTGDAWQVEVWSIKGSLDVEFDTLALAVSQQLEPPSLRCLVEESDSAAYDGIFSYLVDSPAALRTRMTIMMRVEKLVKEAAGREEAELGLWGPTELAPFKGSAG